MRGTFVVLSKRRKKRLRPLETVLKKLKNHELHVEKKKSICSERGAEFMG